MFGYEYGFNPNQHPTGFDPSLIDGDQRSWSINKII